MCCSAATVQRKEFWVLQNFADMNMPVTYLGLSLGFP